MIGSTISHYKILEKLGEAPKLPTSLPAGAAAQAWAGRQLLAGAGM